ncbi:hypothetical protein BMS3Bbin10_02440 [bacterium BMS3Bbin10]|nr:hypothetical protein BMS3Bbin10_02440 [bacterium BMS3Bbin10]
MNLFLPSRTRDHRPASPHLVRLAAKVTLALLVCLPLLAGAGAASAKELRERFAVFDAGSQERVDHSAWNRLLKTYLRESRGKDGLNRVNYAALKAGGMEELKEYLSYLQSVDVARLSRPEQFAFWTNLYNAKTMEIVAGNYPVRSIRDIRLSSMFIPGPWKAKVVQVAGVKLSLDDIEHDIMRPIWRDPRIHYAVNCAAYGCPNLLTRAYTGEALEEMLEEAARAYINSPRGIDFKGSGVVVSSLYDWYAEDFGGSLESIRAHLGKYAEPALAEKIAGVTSFDQYRYNWVLNDMQ